MKKLGVILVLMILFLMSLSTADMWRSASLRKRAMSLKPGDTKADVQRALGRPTRVFLSPPERKTNLVVRLLAVDSETWAYGRMFDLNLALRGELPLLLRMFHPDSNDVAVVFDSSDRVAQVAVPNEAQ